MVPKSIPRVTGREAMAAATAQLGGLAQHAGGTLHPGGQEGGGASLSIFSPLLLVEGIKHRALLAAASGDRWRDDRRRDLLVRGSGTVPGVPVSFSQEHRISERQQRPREPSLPYKRLDLPSHLSSCPCQGAYALPPFHPSHNPTKRYPPMTHENYNFQSSLHEALGFKSGGSGQVTAGPALTQSQRSPKSPLHS